MTLTDKTPICPLLGAALLGCCLAGHAQTRWPTYSTPTLLARVDGTTAWHATPDADLITAKLALGDDDGALVVVARGDAQPCGYYLFDPQGRWRQLLEGQAYGTPGDPGASPDGYFTFAVGYHSNNLVEPGIYTLDTGAGYTAAQPQHHATPIANDSFAPIRWGSATRLADGGIAFSAFGFAGSLMSTGTIWGLLAPNATYATVFAQTASIQQDSAYAQLCTPAINATQGFMGCSQLAGPGHPNADWPLQVHWDDSPLSTSTGVMDPQHLPGLDKFGDIAYLDPRYTTPAVFFVTKEIIGLPANGQFFFGMNSGFGPLLGNSTIHVVRPFGEPLVELAFESHLDSGDALVAGLADAGNMRLLRLLGEGDPVVLEDGRHAEVAHEGQDPALGPCFAINTRGDILLVAHLSTIGGNGERIAAGVGLILLERDVFRGDFEEQP